MIRAVTTRAVQDVPLGTGEGQFPVMEKTIADLPGKEFFLETLDAPGRLDDQGNVVPLPPKAKSARQVCTDSPTTIASGNAP